MFNKIIRVLHSEVNKVQDGLEAMSKVNEELLKEGQALDLRITNAKSAHPTTSTRPAHSLQGEGHRLVTKNRALSQVNTAIDRALMDKAYDLAEGWEDQEIRDLLWCTGEFKRQNLTYHDIYEAKVKEGAKAEGEKDEKT